MPMRQPNPILLPLPIACHPSVSKTEQEDRKQNYEDFGEDGAQHTTAQVSQCCVILMFDHAK